MAEIKAANPDLNVLIVQEGQPLTKDLRMYRVRIMVDKDGKVKHQPRCG